MLYSPSCHQMLRFLFELFLWRLCLADFSKSTFDVEAKSSGDAICLRYELGGRANIFMWLTADSRNTGDAVVKHINTYYGAPETPRPCGCDAQ